MCRCAGLRMCRLVLTPCTSPHSAVKQHWQKTTQAMKVLTALLVTQWLLLSCTPAQEKNARKQESINYPLSYFHPDPDTLSKEQQAAFDALNSIQRQGQHLYSTYPGTHNGVPPDTSFVISQAQLLAAMEELLTRHYTGISDEERTRLAVQVVSAQEEYLVLQRNDYSAGSADNAVFPASGSWILPEVLGRRDIVLEW